MKLNAYNFLLSFFLILTISSCQKEIEVALPDYDKKLVVEGYIENGKFANVTLTRSISYFSTLTIDTFLQKILIRDASVCVRSSKGEMEYLTFQFSPDSPMGFAYVGDSIMGELGTSYSLEIKWNGNIYTSQTSILQPFEIDSVWFAPQNEGTDSAATIRILITDDGSLKNYYQFFVKVRGKKLQDRFWVTSLPVALDDASFNGQTFNFEIFRANPSNLLMSSMTEQERREYYRMSFRPGDTVFFKYASIDFPSYQFWSSAGSDIAFGQNPFMSPTPVISNIKGKNVLGVWCGYAATIDTLFY